MPLGISFFGTAFSEPTLIRLASGFEAATHARVPPKFAPSLPVSNPGVPLAPPKRGEHKGERKDHGQRPHRM